MTFPRAGILLALLIAPLTPALSADPLAPAPSGWQDIRVQVVARTSATLGAPMSGRLAEFPLRDGDRFVAGDVLARFYCGEQEGSLARARAVLRAKREVLSTNSKLNSLGTSSGLEYRVAAAQVEEATADVQIAQTFAEHCVVKAPFAGRVANITEKPQQFVALGAPLLEILDDTTLDLELIVPSRWLSWMHAGTPFEVSVDETGKTYRAAVDRISGKVDPVSQSIKVYGRLSATAPELLAGMSGRAAFEPQPNLGH